MKLAAFLIFNFCFIQIGCLKAEDSTICKGELNKEDQKHGVWICRKGKLVVRKERYKNGVLQTYILFNEKGQIIETRSKKGKVKKYNPCNC